MERVHIIVSGRVQGVFFRHNTNIVANKLGLKGYVKNLYDGSLEIVAEGPEDKLKELISFCSKGPLGASVDNVKVSYEKPKNEFDSFSVRY